MSSPKSLRLPYTRLEEHDIIRYIIDNELETEVGGNVLWRKMEEEKVCDRTWQSMKNHFKRAILKDLNRPEYRITTTELKILRQAWKIQITNVIKPHLKSIIETRPSAPKKTSPPKNKRRVVEIISSSDEEEESRQQSEGGCSKTKPGGWLNHIVSSSEEDEDDRRKSEIEKENRKKASGLATTSKGLSMIINIKKSPSELRQNKSPRIEDTQLGEDTSTKSPEQKSTSRNSPEKSTSVNNGKTKAVPQNHCSKDRSKLSSKPIAVGVEEASADENRLDKKNDRTESSQSTEDELDDGLLQNKGLNNGSRDCENDRSRTNGSQKSTQSLVKMDLLEEQIKRTTVNKSSNSDVRSSRMPSPNRAPKALGWVGKKFQNSNYAVKVEEKNIDSATIQKKRRLSESLQKLKKTKENSPKKIDHMWFTSDEDEVDTTMVPQPSQTQQNQTPIAVKNLRKQKKVEIKKAYELSGSQEEQLKKVTRDLKKSDRIKINPFAIGAQHFSKFKDVQIRPLWPS